LYERTAKSLQQTHAPGPGPDDENLVDLIELVRIFRRRAGLFIGSVLLLMTIATLVVINLTPRYTANTRVLIDPQRQEFIDIEAVITSLSDDAQTVESEIAVIESRGLVGAVVERLGLDELPEFNPMLAKRIEDESEPFFDWRRVLSASWFGAGSRKEKPAPPQPERERVLVIDTVLKALSLKQLGRSRVIEVSFTSKDAALSAGVANTLAELYIVAQLQSKFEGTRRATEWLKGRLRDLRTDVEVSERAVEDFRARSGLIEARDTDIITQQITELNSRLIVSQAEFEGVRARLEKVEELYESGEYKTILDLLGSEIIGPIRRREVELLQRFAELSTEYGPKHPVMQGVDEEKTALDQDVADEAERMINDIRNESAVALERVRSFERSLEKLKQDAAEANTTEVELRQLEREAEANRALFETFLVRLKETEQTGLENADARIISHADVPVGPSFPNRKMILAVALVGAMGVGLGLVFAAEVLETGFLSTDEIERYLSIPGIALVPRIKKPTPHPQDYVVDKPMSALAEAVRSLFTAILLRKRPGSSAISILFTSAVPNEGKTSIVASLARIIAMSGKRVLVIDCDIRRPQIHQLFGGNISPGITTFMRGSPEIDPLIQSDKDSSAKFITAGKTSIDPHELLRSERLRFLIEQMKERFDVILIDSPPVLPVADPKVLADIADGCILVVKWRSTRRGAVVKAVQQMEEANAEVLGAVLTQVDVRHHAKYGYGDSGYYTGNYKKYYID